MKSFFNDEDVINQTSCNGLTLMHVNILGGECVHAWCESLFNRAIDYLPPCMIDYLESFLFDH